MAKQRTTKKRPGHPPTGIRPGEKVSEYERVTLRLPPRLRQRLAAAAGALNQPQWRVMIDALEAYLGDGKPLAGDERRVVKAVLQLQQKRSE